MPRIRPPGTPRAPKKEQPVLHFCGGCYDRFRQIARLLPFGHCARCGRKDDRVSIIDDQPGDINPDTCVGLHLLLSECPVPWFAQDKNLSATAVARMFLRRIRQQANAAKAPDRPAPSQLIYGALADLLPPDNAA